jgi:glycosyltransferase involved in cell wall biosynthesis
MLLGVPVIATNYSGNIDFTTPETSIVVDYDLVPLAAGEYPGGEGQVWADIRLDDLAAAMFKLASEPETCRMLAKAGQDYMTEHYAVPVVSVKHASRIRELLAGLGAGETLLESKKLTSLS